MVYLAYTTVEKFKAYLPNTWLSDAELNTLITKASKLLDSELGGNIWIQSITRRIDGYGKAKIILENNIDTVESIDYHEQWTWRAVELDYIQWSIIYTKQLLPSGDTNIRITYTKWYTEVPDELEVFFHYYCAKLLSLDSYMQWDHHGETVSKKINGLSTSYKTPSQMIDALTTQWGVFEQSFRNILDTYKNFTLWIA